MLGVGGVLVGVCVGFGLATALFRGYLRRHPQHVMFESDPTLTTQLAPPAPSEPFATTIDADITLPRAIVEQVYAQLERLEVLERRDAMRLVRRQDRSRSIRP